MNINIITVGKVKDYYQKAIDEYLKRSKPFSNIKIIEVKETITNDIDKNINEEAKAILNYINDSDYVITLEIEGNSIDSFAFKDLIYNHFLYSDKMIAFVIGGSNGMGEVILKRSNYRLSFGKVTYPHKRKTIITSF